MGPIWTICKGREGGTHMNICKGREPYYLQGYVTGAPFVYLHALILPWEDDIRFYMVDLHFLHALMFTIYVCIYPRK